MNQAVVIGQSHTIAIADAVSAASATGISVLRLAEPKQAGRDGMVTLQEAEQLLSGLAPDVRIFVSIAGTYHNILGLLRSGAAFDVIDGQSEGSDPAAPMVVPYRALAAAFDEQLAGARALHRLKAAGRSPLYLLSSPPPKQSGRFILGRFMANQTRWYRGRSIHRDSIERAQTRLKLWRIEAQSVARFAQTQGMSFVPAPAAATNEDGFLARKYYFSDATHANARYGALVLEQMLDMMKEDMQQVAHGG